MIVFCGAVAVGVAVACVALVPLAPRGTMVGHPERGLLATAGWTRGPWLWEVIRCAGVAAACAAATIGAPAILVVLAAIAPSVLLRWRASTRRRLAGRGALAVLQGAHAAIRSGNGLARALRNALERADPLLREPFDEALRAFDLNAALDAALRRAADHAWDARVAYALDALALVAAEDLPSSRAAAMIGAAADRLAFEQRLAEEVAARTAGLRAQIVLLALIVPALASYLAITMPGLAQTLTSPLGTFVLMPAAAVLEIAGIVASRSIAGAAT